MKRLSLKAQDLITLYTSQDWLTQTEHGQRELVRIAKDFYNNTKTVNDDRIQERYYGMMNMYRSEYDREIAKCTTEEEAEGKWKEFQNKAHWVHKNEEIHFMIDELLQRLLVAINNLNYSQIIILMDQFASMSHHKGKLMNFAKDKLPNSETEDRINGLLGTNIPDRNEDSLLTDMVYHKWGDSFQEIGEGTGALPERAQGYNLRQRGWKNIQDASPQRVLDNVVSVLKNAHAIPKYKKMENKARWAEDPELQISELDQDARIEQTRQWAKDWIKSRYSKDEIVKLITSNPQRYGILYDVLEPDYSSNTRSTVIIKLYHLALDGDKDAYQLLKNMSGHDKISLFHVFWQAMDIDRIDEVLLLCDVLRGAFENHLVPQLYRQISAFVWRHPELKRQVFKSILSDRVKRQINKYIQENFTPMANTSDIFVKTASDKQASDNAIISELVHLADFLDLDGDVVESQKVDLVLSYVLFPQNFMKKEAGMRGILDNAIDFVKNLFDSKNPQIRARLDELIAERNGMEPSNSALAGGTPNIKELLNQQNALEPKPKMVSDFTQRI